jgi:hypothetical protein
MAIRSSFLVAAAVINEKGMVIAACTHTLNSIEICKGEAFVALLAVNLASSLASIAILGRLFGLLSCNSTLFGFLSSSLESIPLLPAIWLRGKKKIA